MFSSIWLKLGAAAAAAILIVTAVLFYNHAIGEVEDLKGTVATQTTAIADLTNRLNAAEAAEKQETANVAALTQLYGSHATAIDKINADLKTHQTFIQSTYKAAPNDKKSILDTALPEFHCVFDGTCKAPAPAGAGVQGNGG